MEKTEDVAGSRSVDDGRSDDLVHCFVVLGVGGVVDQTGAGAMDCAREEGHAEGLVVGYPLEGTDQVSAFEILKSEVSKDNDE